MGQLPFGHRSPPATESPVTTPITNPFNQYAYGANDTLLTDYPLAKVGICRSTETKIYYCCERMHPQPRDCAVLMCSHDPALHLGLIVKTLLRVVVWVVHDGA